MSDFKLNLGKPLCCLDLETTGLQIGVDRIIEIAVIKVHPNGKEENFHTLVNPGIPIPAASSRIHHIHDEDVQDKPTFKEIASELFQFIDNSDLLGFNSNKFDIPLLVEEFYRAGVDFDMKPRRIIDVQNIYHKMERRNLKAAVKFYLNDDLENYHSADADARATLNVFKAQIQRYENVPYEDFSGKVSCPVENDMGKLAEFSQVSKNVDLMGFVVYNEKNQPVFSFGKHKGKIVEEVFLQEPSYYDWIQKADFPHYTKKVLTEIYLQSKFRKTE